MTNMTTILFKLLKIYIKIITYKNFNKQKQIKIKLIQDIKLIRIKINQNQDEIMLKTM